MSKNKDEQKSVSLESLNLVSQCDTPYEFEYIDGAGEGTGVFFTVIGGHSVVVKRFMSRQVRDSRQDAKERISRGKNIKLVTMEDDEEFLIESATVRLVSYRGITQAYNPEHVRTILTINPEIRAQIIAESNKMANFTTNE